MRASPMRTRAVTSAHHPSVAHPMPTVNHPAVMGRGRKHVEGSSAVIEPGKAKVMVTNPAMRADRDAGPAQQMRDPATIEQGSVPVIARSGNQQQDAVVDTNASAGFIWGMVGEGEQTEEQMAEGVLQGKKIPWKTIGIGAAIAFFLARF